MARLIDADALKDTFGNHGLGLDVRWRIDLQPTVDAVEVVHGRWVEMEEPLGFEEINCAVCSVCSDSWVLGDEWDFDEFAGWHNYCPCCGSRMDGDSQ